MSAAPTQPQAPTQQGTCAICQSEIGPTDHVTHCPDCKVAYHADCWRDNGGCAIYGCKSVPETEKVQDVEVPVSYWGREDKACPSCGQIIMAVAVRCRYCGATFESARPRERGEFIADTLRKQRTPKLGVQAIWVLVTGLIPFSAPFCLVIGGLWYNRNKKDLAVMPTMYRAMALIGLAVAAIEIVFFTFALIMLAMVD